MFIPACTSDVYAQQALEILERFVCREKVRVIKFEVSEGGGMMGYHEPFKLDGPRLERQVSLAAREKCTLVLDIGGPGMSSFQPEAVSEIAKSYPEMKVVICHLLAPTLKDEKALSTEGEKYSPEILYWIGYLYRYWACARGERSKRIYRQAPAKTMKRNYMAFHTFDPEVAIDDLIEIHRQRQKQ
jgi:predicted TIM-barrel fold metal-dependent hydrolase